MNRTFQSEAEWHAEGVRLFGDDEMQWRFECPACGHVATVQDYKDAGASVEAVAFSCVGRWMENPRDAFGEGEGPCNYAGGGLIGLNPVIIEGRAGRVFDFAVDEEAVAAVVVVGRVG